MKFSTTFVLASAVASTQALYMEQDNIRSEPKMAARQRMTLNPKAGPFAFTSFSHVVGGASETEAQSAKHWQELGAKRIKIRYGPYTIPSRNGGMLGKLLDGSGGMIWNMPHRNTRKPCTDCTITYMRAGLESTSGASVNSDKGLWLHHMVAINNNGRADATCGSNPASLPHLDVGTMAATAERFFSSGNERTVIDTWAWAPKKVGYYFKKGDTMSFIVDLMNMNDRASKVYMTITYEYVPGKPAGFLAARPVWFDADQCGVSDVKPKAQRGSYVISSRPWSANFDGSIIAMGAHLHDGGTHLEIIRDGKVECDAHAKYAENPQYVSGGMAGMSRSMRDGSATKHISSIELCGNTEQEPDKFPKLQRGQKWVIKGYYDYNTHPGMLNDSGKQSDVMAISIMYVAVPM